MRIALLSVTVFFGTLIGMQAITSVSEMQDAKMTRFCEAVPVGSSYDDTCAKYR